MPIVRVVAALALLVLLVGCSPRDIDGVLWRQVAAYKDPLMEHLFESEGITALDLERDLVEDSELWGALLWNGSSDAQYLDLAEGGSAVWNFESSADALSFSMMISSGPRDPASDALARRDHDTWPAPAAMFTCFDVDFEVVDGYLAEPWRSEEEKQCPEELIDTLVPGAVYQPITTFDG